jgi:hypothetical protein
MRVSLITVAAALGLVAFSGCAGSKPLTPKEQGIRVEQHGYSVLPPPGIGWYVGSRSPETVVFTKDTGTDTRTFIAVATIGPAAAVYDSPSSYLATKQRQIEQMDSSRYRVLEQAAALDSRLGDFCVRYQIRAEDRGAESEGTPEQQATAFARWLIERPPILDVHGYRCLHPNAPQYELDVSYSQRGKAEEHDSSLAREGEAFVASVQFAPLQ